jgi:uncharacterized protein YggE
MGTTYLALLLSLCAETPPEPTPAPREPASVQSITVVGSGAVSAEPDTAEVRLRLVTQAFSASSALRDNASAVESLRRRLGEHGIARKDVKTVTARVVPQMSTIAAPPAQTEVAGYTARSEVRVTVRRLDRLGDVIDDAASEGAEIARDVSYSVENTAPLLAQARKKALADARRRAEAYAREAGMALGEVLHIEEQTPEGQAEGESDTEQEFKASVAVTYALHPKPTARELESKEKR